MGKNYSYVKERYGLLKSGMELKKTDLVYKFKEGKFCQIRSKFIGRLCNPDVFPPMKRLVSEYENPEYIFLIENENILETDLMLDSVGNKFHKIKINFVGQNYKHKLHNPIIRLYNFKK